MDERGKALHRQFEMTGRVAKAMFLAEHPRAKWGSGRARSIWFTRAMAAIREMREPTEAMIEAYQATCVFPSDAAADEHRAALRDAWQAMIDAARFDLATTP